MTLNLLQWVPEGIVLCSDSMVTLTSVTANGPVVTNFEHAEKLIPLGENLPVAVMISGSAGVAGDLISVELKSIGRTIERSAVTPTAETTLTAVRSGIHKFYNERIDAVIRSYAALWSTPENLAKVNVDRRNKGLEPITQVDPARVILQNDPNASKDPKDYDVSFDATVALVFACYFDETPLAYALQWPGPPVEQQVVPNLGKRLFWWGSGGISVGRMINGVDSARLAFVAQMNPEAATALNFFQRQGQDFVMPALFAEMPLQDAVDFAEYLGAVASGYDHFSAGPPGVGGELEIMVLTPGRREWVHQKRIHSKLHRVRGGAI